MKKTQLVTKKIYTENTKIFEVKDVEYIVYWRLEPHCEKSKKIYQVDGKISYKCEHEVKK